VAMHPPLSKHRYQGNRELGKQGSEPVKTLAVMAGDMYGQNAAVGSGRQGQKATYIVEARVC